MDGLSHADATFAERLVERSYALHDEPPVSAFETEPRANSWFIAGDGSAAADLLALATDVATLLERYGIHSRAVAAVTPAG